MENQRFISELTTKTSICSVTCSVFPWFSHVFPWYSHYPCLMGPHDAWGGLPLSGEAIMRKYDEIRVVFFNGFIYNVYCIYMSPDSGSLAPPPMVWSPKLTPPQWYGPPSSRSRERRTRDHTYMHACIMWNMPFSDFCLQFLKPVPRLLVACRDLGHQPTSWFGFAHM